VLDAFIIEQIRKRDRQQVDERPTLQLPLPEGQEPRPSRPADQGSRPGQDDEGPRGVIVIDFA
jgi:hypothetical protein